MAKKNSAKAKSEGNEAGESSSSAPNTSTNKKGKAGAGTAVNARHILCEKHGKKETALERLRAGERFDVVAREVSEDKARSGGALGWKTRGTLIKEFEEVAYALEVSTTAAPKWGEVKTREGYHIIMVEGRK